MSMADLDLKRLASVLGMLGSEHEGEIVSAARKASAMIQAAGMTWAQVLAQVGAARPAGVSQSVTHPVLGVLLPPVGDTWAASVVWLCQRRAGRDPRENFFLDRLSVLLNHTLRGEHAPAPLHAARVIAIYERFAGAPVRRTG